METFDKYIIFLLNKQRFALNLSRVERVVHMIEITQLPKSPEFVLGTINFHGDFLPVISLRKLFLFPAKEADVNDKLIIADTCVRKVALHVDSVEDIVKSTDLEIIKAAHSFTNNEYIDVVFKYGDNIILLYDILKFLKINENTFLKMKMKMKEKKRTVTNKTIKK